MLGHAFSKESGNWPQGVACLATGTQGQWPPLAAIVSDHGGTWSSRLEWIGAADTARYGPRDHDDAPGGRSARGVWLSNAPDALRAFVDAA
jgi:hypothetical protein